MGNTPLRLDEGHYLESTKVLLPWGTPWDELKKIGRPGVYDRPKARGYSEIVWRNRRCIGGLNCTVEAEIFYVGREWPNGKKRLACLEIILPGSEAARLKFDRAEQHLLGALGEPTSKTEVVDEYSNRFPLATQSFSGVNLTLSIGERYVEYFSFVIERVNTAPKAK